MCLKSHQPPLDLDAQIENLKGKGLTIPDEEDAKSLLNDVSYFRLIKAYSLDFKIKNGNYHASVSFDQIVALYLFNSNLRQTIFPLIEQIEINFRCRIANYFSNKYGILGYENSKNFYNTYYHSEFLKEIGKEVNRNIKSPFVKNFQENYMDGKIPFYAIVELISFKTLSLFYKNLLRADKKNIAKIYNIGFRFLESWMGNIAFVRNICAHYGRLYNARFSITPILYKQYASMGNNRLFATLICFKHLLPNDRHWLDFTHTLELLLEKYPDAEKGKIGFPDNWKEILEGHI